MLINPLNLVGVVAGVRRQKLVLLGPSEYVPPEYGDRIQSLKGRVLK
jgi:hypothetical protein